MRETWLRIGNIEQDSKGKKESEGDTTTAARRNSTKGGLQMAEVLLNEPPPNDANCATDTVVLPAETELWNAAIPSVTTAP